MFRLKEWNKIYDYKMQFKQFPCPLLFFVVVVALSVGPNDLLIFFFFFPNEKCFLT